MSETIPEINQLLAQLDSGVRALVTECSEPPTIVGIRTGGLWLAQYLSRALALDEPVSEIDVGFHRDDFATRGLGERAIAPSYIHGNIDAADVLLVDDVLHTGRTVRAALNAIFEYGRPRRVWLAVLVEREGRQLPLQADVAGARLTLPSSVRLRLGGPDPLALTLTPVAA